MTPLRIFIDSNVLRDGLLSNWSAARAILILAARRTFRLVRAEDARLEVERNLLKWLGEQPERDLIRHPADVPVLVAAMKARPDWLVTKNTHHFTQEVAQRTGLKIIHLDRFIKVLQIRG